MANADRYRLWGGCFSEEPSAVLRRLNDSLAVDVRMYREDISGSRAWARELHRSGHLSEQDHSAIQCGLDEVEKDIEKDLSKTGRLNDTEEDIHSVVERRLHAHAGDAALRLHTARSRNDQAATDTRLWMLASLPTLDAALKQLIEMHKPPTLNLRSRNDQAATDTMLWMLASLPTLDAALKQLIEVLLKRASDELDIIAPGYTHLQRAQPIRWSHFLLSYAWGLRDDVTRLEEQMGRLSMCPLGSGAMAGCALPIDRTRLARSLGFKDITPNSMFAVSSRDHIVEFLNWTALCGLHLSRLSEDLIIYSSQEFGIVRLSDQFSTGSSLMPQKRNPDGLELVRGAAGLLLGDSYAFSCVLKGLPSTYNKDMQSDKEIMFRAYDKLLDCLKVTMGTICTMEVDRDKALSCLEPGMLATDLAHALVRRGVPFRRAHHLLGAALRRAADLGVDLQGLPHSEYVAISPQFGTEQELAALFSWEASVEQYSSAGGTAKRVVEQQMEALWDWLRKRAPCAAPRPDETPYPCGLK